MLSPDMNTGTYIAVLVALSFAKTLEQMLPVQGSIDWLG
jgi:hypothetical protein